MKATLVPLCAAALMLAGCGQKGPLVLPERNTKVVTRPAAPAGEAAPATAPEAAPQKPDDQKDKDDSQNPKR